MTRRIICLSRLGSSHRTGATPYTVEEKREDEALCKCTLLR